MKLDDDATLLQIVPLFSLSLLCTVLCTETRSDELKNEAMHKIY